MAATVESLRAEGMPDEDVALLRRGRKMSSLVGHEGWAELQMISVEQIRTRVKILLGSSAQRPEGTASDEYLKGVVYGIQLMLETPEIIIRQARELISGRDGGDGHDE